MKLTAKQEKFAQGVASGMSLSDAYRDAYNSASMKPETIHKRASELMEDGEVAGRVKAIQDEITAKTVEKELWSREQSILALIPLTSSDKEAAVVAAVKELNEMHGFKAPTKIEHSGMVASMDVAAGLTDAQKQQAAIAILRQHGGPAVEAFAKDVLRAQGYEFED